MNLNLMAIMQEDPDMAERLAKGTKEVRESKESLVSAAGEYNTKYKDEIEEGTRQRQLLLEQGKAQGKKESEIFVEYGKFIPTRHTPIMNFLFFLMRDGDKPDWVGIQRDLNEDCGHVNENLVEAISEEELDKIYGQLIHDDEEYANVQEPDDMTKYIYGNMTHDMFIKIKKLKALSKSPNENEAFLAYRLCLKLCKKYSLEFDKVPCDV